MKKIIGIVIASLVFCNIGLAEMRLIEEKNYLNTAAALLQQSIYEMIIFIEKQKGKKETVM